MSFKLLGGSSDLNTIISDVNSNILELKNREVTEFFKDDSGIRRVMLGKGGGGFYGLKTSPENVDVYTATDNQLTFNSDQNVFKIVGTDIAAFPEVAGASSGSQASESIDIDTGVPSDVPLIALCFNYSVEGSAIMLPYIATIPGSGFGGLIAYDFQVSPYLDVLTGTVHIAIEATNFIAGILPASTIKWYLLQETAN